MLNNFRPGLRVEKARAPATKSMIAALAGLAAIAGAAGWRVVETNRRVEAEIEREREQFLTSIAELETEMTEAEAAGDDDRMADIRQRQADLQRRIDAWVSLLES